MNSNSTETESQSFDYPFILFQCLFCVILSLAGFLVMRARGWPWICFDSLVGGRSQTLGIQTETQAQDPQIFARFRHTILCLASSVLKDFVCSSTKVLCLFIQKFSVLKGFCFVLVSESVF